MVVRVENKEGFCYAYYPNQYFNALRSIALYAPFVAAESLVRA